VDQPVDAADDTVPEAAAEPACHLHDGPALHPDTARHDTCAGATRITMRQASDGTPARRRPRHPQSPSALRRAVLDRARGRCQRPGCNRRSWLSTM
jgi:hypothetical protein